MMKRILFLCLLPVALTFSAAAQSPSTCDDYYGGEPNLTAQEGRYLAHGGMIRVCRKEGKIASILSSPRPTMDEFGVCKYVASAIAFVGNSSMVATGGFWGGLSRDGQCPPPGGKAYVTLIGSGATFIRAQHAFQTMQQAPGLPSKDAGRPVTFEDLKIPDAELFSVKARGDDHPGAQPPGFAMEVRSTSQNLRSYLLLFDVVDGKPLLVR